MTVDASVLDDMIVSIDEITITDQIDIFKVRMCHFDARVHDADQDSVSSQAEVVLECVDVRVLIGPT